ncbi:MAG: hypothetical protein Q7K40_03865 [bacterium]|nr:hypothetical protein [bacterium]
MQYPEIGLKMLVTLSSSPRARDLFIEAMGKMISPEYNPDKQLVDWANWGQSLPAGDAFQFWKTLIALAVTEYTVPKKLFAYFLEKARTPPGKMIGNDFSVCYPHAVILGTLQGMAAISDHPWGTDGARIGLELNPFLSVDNVKTFDEAQKGVFSNSLSEFGKNNNPIVFRLFVNYFLGTYSRAGLWVQVQKICVHKYISFLNPGQVQKLFAQA